MPRAPSPSGARLIRRWQRELKQKTILAQFYASADALLDREVDVAKLLVELKALAAKTFSHAESSQEWNQEAALRVNGALDNFEVMRGQFGVRNGIRTGSVASRSPLRLAGLGIAGGAGTSRGCGILTRRAGGGKRRGRADAGEIRSSLSPVVCTVEASASWVLAIRTAPSNGR